MRIDYITGSLADDQQSAVDLCMTGNVELRAQQQGELTRTLLRIVSCDRAACIGQRYRTGICDIAGDRRRGELRIRADAYRRLQRDRIEHTSLHLRLTGIGRRLREVEYAVALLDQPSRTGNRVVPARCYAAEIDGDITPIEFLRAIYRRTDIQCAIAKHRIR